MADNTGDILVGKVGGRPGRPRVQPLVHGGFRRNRHHEGIESLADSRGMGRDLLRRTDSLGDGDDGSHSRMVRLQPASRSGNKSTKDSPWSRG